jgi:hypothetical protein
VHGQAHRGQPLLLEGDVGADLGLGLHQQVAVGWIGRAGAAGREEIGQRSPGSAPKRSAMVRPNRAGDHERRAPSMPPSPTVDPRRRAIRCGAAPAMITAAAGGGPGVAPVARPCTGPRRPRQAGEMPILGATRGSADRPSPAGSGAVHARRRAWSSRSGLRGGPSVDAPRVRAYHSESRDPIPWSPFLRVGARTLRTEQCAKSQCVYPVDLGRCGSPCLPARRSYETAPQEGRSGCAARGGRLSNNEPETGLHGRVQRFSTESLILAQDERWRRA